MNERTKNDAVTIVDRLLPPLFRMLCKHPNDMQFAVQHYPTESVVRVRPHEDDFPLLLGTGAKTFRSLRIVCRAISQKHGHNIVLEHLQGGRDSDSAKIEWPEIPADEKFDLTPLRQLLVQTVQAFSTGAALVVTKEGNSHRILVEVQEQDGLNELELESALTTLWNAMAKIRGGDLRIQFRRCATGAVALPPEPDAELQPETAAGRFAEETA